MARLVHRVAALAVVFAVWPVAPASAVFVQQGPPLRGSGQSIGDGGAALSAAGNTALLVGRAEVSGASVPRVWVFTRSGSAWIQQGAALTPNDATGDDFGSSVALSADGTTALIGGATDNSVGAAWVFTRTGSSWTQQGPKLTANDETGIGYFGGSVALSADGNIALIGGWRDNSFAGAAWVFTRTGSSWTQQGGKLTGNDEIGAGYFGRSVALSADGNTALVGGPFDNSGVGAAWVFTRTGSSWTQQGGKLTGNDETGQGRFGWSVALSADASTALIGGPYDRFTLTPIASPVGAAWVFTRSGATWTQQGSKLTGGGGPRSNAGTYSDFGAGAALSWDGNTALVGGGSGAWAFTRSGSTWSQQPGPKLTGTGGGGDPDAGSPVALSADGNLALLGGSVRLPSVFRSTTSSRAWIFAPTASDQFGNWFALYDGTQLARCTSSAFVVASLTVPYSAQRPPRYTAGLLWIDYFGIPFAVSPAFNLSETGLSALGVEVPLPIALFGLPIGQYNVHMLLWNDSRQFGTLSSRTTYLPYVRPDCSAWFSSGSPAGAARRATLRSATSRPPHRVIVARLRAARRRALAAGKKPFAKLFRVPRKMTGTKKGYDHPRARVCGRKVCVTFDDGPRRKTVALPLKPSE